MKIDIEGDCIDLNAPLLALRHSYSETETPVDSEDNGTSSVRVHGLSCQPYTPLRGHLHQCGMRFGGWLECEDHASKLALICSR